MLPSRASWIAGGMVDDLGGYPIFRRHDGPVGGRPVTLLHGYPTSSHDWAMTVPALTSAGCRVTTLDFLGFGASAKPRGHDYRITEQADLVEQLWARSEITETALIAHDYGVSVAQELLARDPGRISRVAWLNGGLYINLYRPLPVQRLMVGPLGKVLGPLMFEASFRSSLRRICGRGIGDADLHEMWTDVIAGGGRRVQWALNRYHGERRRNAERWQHAAESFSGPVLFVWGPIDPISGSTQLPRLRERFPAAEFLVLEQDPPTGHYPQVENPEPVAARLATFVST